MGTGFSYGNELPVPCFFRKFISLFLVFFLLMFSVNLYAKEKRGAKLIITKKDGQQIEGELITVKPNSLLLLSANGRDVSVNVVDISIIRIVKKSMVLRGTLAGILGSIGTAVIGVGTLALILKASVGEALPVVVEVAGMLSAFFVPVGAIIGAVAGTDKTIQIYRMTDKEIQKTLKKLRKKARIRDYK